MKMYAMSFLVLLLGASSIGHSQDRAVARCGSYTLGTNKTATIFLIESKGVVYTAAVRDCSGEEELVDITCYSAEVSEGALEIVRTVTWFSHRDRVKNIESTASLKTASGTSELTCTDL